MSTTKSAPGSTNSAQTGREPLRVAIVCGNTHRPSRSRILAQHIAEAANRSVSFDLTWVEIVDIGADIGPTFTRVALPPKAIDALSSIESADAIIAVSPVYKGSYTGLFKHLFDFVGMEALRDVPVAIGATGGTRHHALMVEHQMRPLFASFCARILPTAVFAEDSAFADGVLVDPQTAQRAGALASELARDLTIMRANRTAEPASWRAIR